MSTKPVGTNEKLTDRQDNWWLEPLWTVLSLGSFGIYTMYVAFSEAHFLFEGGGAHYLSPFYSVPIPGVHYENLSWLPFSPAFLFLWIPLGFRATCYYYRKSYYRAFFWDPPACAVPEGKKKGYSGERAFPFILNNLHRYFWYLSLPVVAFLWYDTFRAFFFSNGAGGYQFGVSVGALVMLAGVLLISYYTFSCHAWRHIAGGCLNCFSNNKTRYGIWQRITHINEQHGFWAVTSMFGVWGVDLYIRLCSMGVITDIRFF